MVEMRCKLKYLKWLIFWTEDKDMKAIHFYTFIHSSKYYDLFDIIILIQ